MKVLKFGGTSVGTAGSILSLKKIVESAAENETLIVVVSALGGITDQLIRTARMAESGDDSWREEHHAMLQRHVEMVRQVVSEEKQPLLEAEIQAHFEELASICYGVSLIKDLSEKTLAAIVSYGERLSSRIVSMLINGAVWHDARALILTLNHGGKHELAAEPTNERIRATFASSDRISVVGGFISSDLQTGETTNLGRGGSDYTAAIIAAALDASVLEIWTDVNGFMSADPRVIPSAYTIPELTYNEASELCNFGAKVIYPPTIYPVCLKNIPILIKNTFNPSDAGSVIQLNTQADQHVIKGISQIKNVSLLTVSGLSMVGVVGVNRRIFTCLAQAGISAFMVSQANSENSTSIGVRQADAIIASEALNREFAAEIHTGSMRETWVQNDLAAIAIVGENMRHRPGIAGKLFSSLGDAEVSVVAFAQGAAETNISFIVRQNELDKVLPVVHNAFFCPCEKSLHVIVCGVGTVGGRLLKQIHAQQEKLANDEGLQLRVAGIASSRKFLFREEGINLETYDSEMKAADDYASESELLDAILALHVPHRVFVDCTASEEVAKLYPTLLEHGIHVVAANKMAASDRYEQYQYLHRLAREHGVSWRYATNVGAGLPVINTIRNLRLSGDRVSRVQAVVSGTLGFLFSRLSAEMPFSKVVELAKTSGFCEPDPRQDLSGADVARKILILAREAGWGLNTEDVQVHSLLPDQLMNGSLDDFWKQLPQHDQEWESRRLKAEAEGKRLRYVATFEDGKARIGLEAVEPSHPFYTLDGANNCVAITSAYYPSQLVIQGAGAGADVTAAGLFADILSCAN